MGQHHDEYIAGNTDDSIDDDINNDNDDYLDDYINTSFP